MTMQVVYKRKRSDQEVSFVQEGDAGQGGQVQNDQTRAEAKRPRLHRRNAQDYDDAEALARPAKHQDVGFDTQDRLNALNLTPPPSSSSPATHQAGSPPSTSNAGPPEQNYSQTTYQTHPQAFAPSSFAPADPPPSPPPSPPLTAFLSEMHLSPHHRTHSDPAFPLSSTPPNRSRELIRSRSDSPPCVGMPYSHESFDADREDTTGWAGFAWKEYDEEGKIPDEVARVPYIRRFNPSRVSTTHPPRPHLGWGGLVIPQRGSGKIDVFGTVNLEADLADRANVDQNIVTDSIEAQEGMVQRCQMEIDDDIVEPNLGHSLSSAPSVKIITPKTRARSCAISLHAHAPYHTRPATPHPGSPGRSTVPVYRSYSLREEPEMPIAVPSLGRSSTQVSIKAPVRKRLSGGLGGGTGSGSNGNNKF